MTIALPVETIAERINPSRKIAQMPLYREIGWSPHLGQERVIDSKTRNRVVAAGRRFGKSEIGGHKLVQEAMQTKIMTDVLQEMGKRREFWIVGPTYTDAEKEFRVLWNRLVRMGFEPYFDRPGTYNDPQGGNMHLSMFKGTFQVHAKSAKHPESLVGEGLCGAVFAEAAKLKEVIYTKYVRPTLADFNGWSLMTSTPEGKNWFYERWQMGQDPGRPDWSSFRMPSWTNPFVYPHGGSDEGIDRLRTLLHDPTFVLTDAAARKLGLDPEIAALVADLTDVTFNQEIGALFTEFVGRVFQDFDEETHVGDYSYNPRWATYAAVDYGFTNPFVWLLLQVDPHGEQIIVLDEVYEPGLMVDEAATLIRDRGLAPSSTLAFYPDPASPGDTRILERELRISAKGGTGGEIRWRVDAIRNALKIRNAHLPEGAPDRVPSLRINRRCKSLIHDMLNYRYPEKRGDAMNGAENPMKKDDHGPEALGRFFAGHFGTPDKNARRARQRKAHVHG